VLTEYQVRDGDLDGDGAVRAEVIGRWVDAAREEYLERCPTLWRAAEERGLRVRHRSSAVPPGALAGRPTSVVVSASASEVRPAAVAVSVRLRPVGEREAPLNVTCTVRLEDPETAEAAELGDAIRDELIANEHAARHFN